jgi:chromosome segregation ATPase
MIINKQKFLLTVHISELKSSISEMEKHLNKLQVMKYECKERCSALKNECTKLKESGVSIRLLSVLLNSLMEWYDARDCGNVDDFSLWIKGF